MKQVKGEIARTPVSQEKLHVVSTTVQLFVFRFAIVNYYVFPSGECLSWKS